MQLEKEKVIKQRLDYALINPVAVGGAVYCMLPTKLGTTDIPWAIVGRGDDARGRLCWVSEIELPDGSLQYFFELEVLDEEARSEERRVGKECRSRWSPDHLKKKKKE